MKALSVLKPWARLLAGGEKVYETRSWSTDYRGGIAIHASARFDAGGRDLALELVMSGEMSDNFPLGGIVGVGVLVDVHRTEDLVAAGLVNEREDRFGDFEPGRFALEFRECKPLREVIRCHGQLGLWEWDPPVGFEDPQ